MTVRMNTKDISYCCLAGTITALCLLIPITGCVRESEDSIRARLEIICEDDLATVISELDPASIGDSTFYRIVEFGMYREGKYSYKAEVDYFFLARVRVKMVRKYRYHSGTSKWERYFNEYRFIHD